jgi:hypothetical protein
MVYSIFLGKTHDIGTNFVYVKFVRYNLIVSHCHNVCNCKLTNNISCAICMYVYDLSPYTISHAEVH